MHRILSAFSTLMKSEIKSMGDTKALQLLLDLLDRKDIFILSKKDGPIFHALVKHFRLSGRSNGHDPLDDLDPQTVCRVLIEWRLLQIKLQQYLRKSNLKKLPTGSDMIPTRNQSPLQLEFKGV